MKFLRANGGVLEISTNAERILADHRQVKMNDVEAGGILLGRMIINSRDVVVDIASLPSPNDRRGRFSFFRARNPAQLLVDRAWSESGQVINYLGEWHTHPEDDPQPSCIDRRDWKKIVTRALFDQDFLIFIIVGRTTIRAWEISRTRPKPVPLVSEQLAPIFRNIT
jgi:integrative and conjugative element protein (TIGR02256 family)